MELGNQSKSVKLSNGDGELLWGAIEQRDGYLKPTSL